MSWPNQGTYSKDRGPSEKAHPHNKTRSDSLTLIFWLIHIKVQKTKRGGSSNILRHVTSSRFSPSPPLVALLSRAMQKIKNKTWGIFALFFCLLNNLFIFHPCNSFTFWDQASFHLVERNENQIKETTQQSWMFFRSPVCCFHQNKERSDSLEEYKMQRGDRGMEWNRKGEDVSCVT